MNEPPNSAGDEIQLPRGERVDQLRHLIETLRIADEVANRGYLITSAEVADLMDINPGAVAKLGNLPGQTRGKPNSLAIGKSRLGLMATIS